MHVIDVYDSYHSFMEKLFQNLLQKVELISISSTKWLTLVPLFYSYRLRIVELQVQLRKELLN
jgi:hypothetical protein